MKKRLSVLFITVFFIVGCIPTEPVLVGRNSSSFLPNLPTYNMTNAIDIVKSVNVVDKFSEFITGQSVPNAVSDIADTLYLRQLDLVQNYLECIMGTVDAFSIRFYSHKEIKTAVGAVLAVNWDRFANIINQLGCLIPNPFFNDAESDPGLRPCADAWEYRENNVRYYFIYVGTSVKICQDFANSLPRNN